MPHTHWPDGKGPVCKFRTKSECDKAYRAWQEEEFEKLAQRAADHWNPALSSRMGNSTFTRRVLAILEERKMVEPEGSRTPR